MNCFVTFLLRKSPSHDTRGKTPSFGDDQSAVVRCCWRVWRPPMPIPYILIIQNVLTFTAWRSDTSPLVLEFTIASERRWPALRPRSRYIACSRDFPTFSWPFPEHRFAIAAGLALA